MAVITVPGMFVPGDHASRPAATAVGSGTLYSCSTHSLIYQSDGATWTTWATLGETGAAAHIADAADAHDASAVSIVDTGTYFTGTDVEAALQELGAISGTTVATDAIWDAAADTVVGTGANTAVRRKNNDSAAAAPTVNEDSGDGYAIGSRWIDTTNDKEYIALDVTVAAAVWKETTGAGSLADQGAFTYLDATEAAAPGTPASGKVRVYAKADGRVYSKDDAGVESGPFDAAGGAAGPLLYADSLTLDASGDEFTDNTLTGWTQVGSGTATAVTTEVYDATAIDLQFSAASDRIYKAIDAAFAAGTKSYYLTIHGINDSTSPASATGGMLSLYVSDNGGAGSGVSVYNDNNSYLWTIAGNAFSASNQINSTWPNTRPPFASSWPIIYRLSTNGSTTVTGAVSFDGGARWSTITRTDSTTWTRVGVLRAHTAGATNPTLRIGRFNLA